MTTFLPTVANILRDKANGWSLDYYNDKKTIHDVPLLRAQAMLELMKKEGELEAAQKKHAAFLACSKRPDQRLKDDIKAVESVVSQLKSEASKLAFSSHGAERAYSFSNAEDIIHTLAYKQLLEQQRSSNLQSIRNNFMVNGDEEAMRQAVAAVESRFTTSMASLSQLKPAPAPSPAPALAPVAGRSKKCVSYSEDDDWVDLEQLVMSGKGVW
jgi:hypothetical protein